MSKPIYEVIVGNIGSVYQGTDAEEAQRKFSVYVKQSESCEGRAGGEEVTLMKDGDIIKTHEGLRSIED